MSGDVHTRGCGVRPVAAIVATIASIANASVAIAWVAGVAEDIRVSLSLPLGDMDDSSRVGNVTSSCSVTSSDGRDGGSGEASDADGGGGGDAGVAGSGVGKGIAIASVAFVASIAETVVAEEVGVGFS